MSITTEDLGDLVNTTLTAFDYGKWTDLTGDIQEYHAHKMREIIRAYRALKDMHREGTP